MGGSMKTAHITMSTAVNVAASRSSELLRMANENIHGILCKPTRSEIVLEGIVGVVVHLSHQQHLLASVSKAVLQKLTDFADDKIPGSSLTFRGGALSRTERAGIHGFCEARGIQSRSEGPKDHRKMVLTIPKFLSLDIQKDQVQENFRVVQNATDMEEDNKYNRKYHKKLRAKDARNINERYLCVSREVFSMISWQKLDQGSAMEYTSVFGELYFDESSEPEIVINPDLPEPKSTESNEAILRILICFGKLPSGIEQPIVIVMRGLPGSGKSSWAKALQSKCGGQAAIVSADSYFETSKGYKFDPNQRGAAHDHSRAMYMEALQEINPQKVAILVDNTNSKRSEYEFYVHQAQKANKRILTVEILCRSEDEMKIFYHRGLHNVPIQYMGRMHSRWEVEEEAFLFQSGASSLVAKKTNRP